MLFNLLYRYLRGDILYNFYFFFVFLQTGTMFIFIKTNEPARLKQNFKQYDETSKTYELHFKLFATIFANEYFIRI